MHLLRRSIVILTFSFLLAIITVRCDVKYCNNIDWDNIFFDSNLYHFFGETEQQPKWWKGKLTARRAWSLLGPLDYAKSVAALGNVMQLKNVILKAEAGGDVNIVVMGGSVTKGNECGRGAEIICAWPKRLETILHAVGAKSVKIHNVAEGGTDVSFGYVQVHGKVWRQKSGLRKDPDMFLLAFSSNDRLLMHTNAGSAFVESAYEDVIRAIYSAYPDAAIVIATEISRDPYIRDPSTLASFDVKIEGYITNVAQYYGIPVWSYKDAVWSKHLQMCTSKNSTGTTPSATGKDFACGRSPYQHPESLHFHSGVHTLYAYVMAYNIYNSYRHICTHDRRLRSGGSLSVDQQQTLGWDVATRGLPPRKFDRPESATCVTPRTLYIAQEGMNSTGFKSEHWSHFADRKDKYGWIATKSGAYIEFPVILGAACDAVSVTYVTSYTKEWGAAQFFLRVRYKEETRARGDFAWREQDVELAPTIDALSSELVTVTKTQFLQLRSLSAKIYIFTGNQKQCNNISAILVARLFKGTKFKITSVMTCESIII